MTNKIKSDTGQTFMRRLKRFSQNYTIAYALILLIVVMSLASDSFLKPANLVNLLKQLPSASLVAIGMTFVMIFGGVDLSVTAVLTMSGVMTVTFVEQLGMVPAILIAIAVGLLIGALNGVILSFIRGDVSANFMVTLGTQTLFTAIASIITGGASIYAYEATEFRIIGQGDLLTIPCSTIILIVIGVILHILLSKTAFGRKVYMSGGNRIAARFSGIKINTYRMAGFLISAFCASIAGIIVASRVGGAEPAMGKNYEFDAIAAICIGGNSMFGGIGNLARTMIGVVLMLIISNAMNLFSVPSELQNVMRGIIILAAVWVDVKKKVTV
jgi:ribose transport system permease protein